MRWLAVLLWMVWLQVPAYAARPVTADQLELILRGVRGEPDGRIARRLRNLELTEPVAGARLVEWEQALPGMKSRQALSLLVDVVAFRDTRPLPTDGAPDAPPDMTIQQHIFKLGVDYVTSVLPRLPNLMATRQIEYYEELKPVAEDGGETAALYQPLHSVGRAMHTVFYRDGAEVVDAAPVKAKGEVPAGQQLETRGVFGPILAVVVADALRGRLVWGRWETGESGPEAVFRYSVPRARSHYQVFCCVDYAGSAFRENPAYHGEIALDPVTGTVLRLQIVADMEPDVPIRKSGILVEYGQVSIAGIPYVCPVRSVSLVVEWERGSRVRRTSLNDVVFSRYRRFGAESRMVIEDAVDTP